MKQNVTQQNMMEQIGYVRPLKSRGFTMVEIMVVVAIIAILAVMIVPQVTGRDDQAKVTRVKQDIRAMSSALDLYKLDNFKYPTTDEGLESLVTAPADAKNWAPGGYLKRLKADPWGNDYIYISPGAQGAYDLVSLGADGQEGGQGADADISSNDL